MQLIELNHVGVHVADLARSRQFYCEVLGLAEVARPEMGFPGAWIALPTGQQVHLIGRAIAIGAPPPVERHFAFAVTSIDDAAAELRHHAIEFSGPKLRPDGAWQIFVRDPDGHVVELCQLMPG